MDSLRQLAMKFLEREELADCNFQNEFLRSFVIVMRKSNSADIRELIVRCLSQMVLSRVSNVKSGRKMCAAAGGVSKVFSAVFCLALSGFSMVQKNVLSNAIEWQKTAVFYGFARQRLVCICAVPFLGDCCGWMENDFGSWFRHQLSHRQSPNLNALGAPFNIGLRNPALALMSLIPTKENAPAYWWP
ncbi:hypothetical protein C3L33_22906, partial [Rhododendron williamsianum]